MTDQTHSTLPPFTPEGLLPPGDYDLTLEQLRASMLVVGPGDADRYPHWDTQWRMELTRRLATMCRQLWQVGVTEIFIDGSFVEDKEHPNDIDGYFVCELMELATGRLQQELNLLDPDKIWTWEPRERRPYRAYPKRQLPMWHSYRVELYPHFGQPSGITDEHGNTLEFPAAFRKTRESGTPKGIIRLRKGDDT